MAYNPYYPYQPYSSTNAIPYTSAWNGAPSIIKVNGRNGAEAYALPPNSSALLLDESNPIVYLKTTDGAGYATVTAYDITPHQTSEQKEEGRLDALEKRIASLEAALNGKSDLTGG